MAAVSVCTREIVKTFAPTAAPKNKICSEQVQKSNVEDCQRALPPGCSSWGQASWRRGRGGEGRGEEWGGEETTSMAGCGGAAWLEEDSE